MQIDQIAQATGSVAAGAGSAPAERLVGGFADVLRSSSEQVGRVHQEAQQATVDLLSGQGVDVHTAMMAAQRAEITFELALQVRNKAVAAYQQMMQMQF